MTRSIQTVSHRSRSTHWSRQPASGPASYLPVTGLKQILHMYMTDAHNILFLDPEMTFLGQNLASTWLIWQILIFLNNIILWKEKTREETVLCLLGSNTAGEPAGLENPRPPCGGGGGGSSLRPAASTSRPLLGPGCKPPCTGWSENSLDRQQVPAGSASKNRGSPAAVAQAVATGSTCGFSGK